MQNAKCKVQNEEGGTAAVCAGRTLKSKIINHQSKISRGFTLIELTASLAILALAVGAVAAFTMAMTDAWRASETKQSVQSNAMQGKHRLQAMIKRSRYIGWSGTYSDASGAGVMIWREDLPGTGYGQMQMSEMALVEFNAQNKVVRVMQVDPASPLAGQLGDVEDLDDETDVANFKALPGLVESPMIKNVKSATFRVQHADDQEQRPTVEIVFETQKQGYDRVDYQSATVRAATTQPKRCKTGACPCTSSQPDHCATQQSCGCAGSSACRTSLTSPCGPNGPSASANSGHGTGTQGI